MSQNEQLSIEPIRKLLRAVLLNRAADVDALLDELKPVCELDRQSERNLFWAHGPGRSTDGLSFIRR